MLDGTICDIYLVNESGQLVGRPVLVIACDANTSLCLGYSLLWEGGTYSLQTLMLHDFLTPKSAKTNPVKKKKAELPDVVEEHCAADLVSIYQVSMNAKEFQNDILEELKRNGIPILEVTI